MASQNFDLINGWTGISEGGFTKNKKDPGNWSTGKAGKGILLGTNHGITGRVLQGWRGKRVSMSDVRNLTKEEANKIYRAQYWDAVNGDQLPSGIDYAVYDYGVNSGPSRAIKSMQKALGVVADGQIGVMTLNALRNCDKPDVIAKICEERWAFMKRLKVWPHFKKGWTRRVMGNMIGFQSDDIGVIDRSIMLYNGSGVDIPAPKPKPQSEEPTGKADPKDTSSLSAWLSPDGMTKAGMAASGLSGILSGSGPIQWAFAIVFVILACVAGYILISRERQDA